MRKFNLICILQFVYWVATAQVPDQAKTIVNILASDSLYGRGYVFDGDKKAAKYIQNQFKAIGLKPLGSSYFQTFTTPVNTFPGVIKVAVNGNTLTPGRDYIVDAGSPGINGNYPIMCLSAKDLLDLDVLREKLAQSNNSFLLIKSFKASDFDRNERQQLEDVVNFLKYSPQNPALGTIEITNNKLLHRVSSQFNAKPLIIISKEALTPNPQIITLEIEQEFKPEYITQNVAGFLPGKKSDSLLVFMAHYDHLGTMGKANIFPGANDNASGVAMLIELATYFKANPQEYSMVFLAFGAEELGLLGSRYFIDHPLVELGKIKFLLNFDIAGTGDDGIQVVNGSVYRKQFDRLKELNQHHALLKNVKIRGEACISDHCFFSQKGIPGFYIYTLGGIQAYHDIYDKAETLPLTEFKDYKQLIIKFIEGF